MDKDVAIKHMKLLLSKCYLSDLYIILLPDRNEDFLHKSNQMISLSTKKEDTFAGPERTSKA